MMSKAVISKFPSLMRLDIYMPKLGQAHLCFDILVNNGLGDCADAA